MNGTTPSNTVLQLSLLAVMLWAAVASGQPPFSSRQPDYPNWSAFTGIKFNDEISVEYEGKWYVLVSFQGRNIAEIEAFAKELAPRRHQKRIAEDLVQLLRLMGVEIDKEATVVLRDKDGVTHTFEASMTTANRDRLQASLTDNVEMKAKLTHVELMSDLRALAQRLELQFAYVEANQVELQPVIEDILRRYPNAITRRKLADELNQIMARFIDGHFAVDENLSTNVYMPFLVEPSGNRFVAFLESRDRHIVDGFPYIAKIDDVDLQVWLKSLDDYTAKGSTQYRRRRQLKLLRDIEFTRRLLGSEKQADPCIEVALANKDGQIETVQLKVIDSKPQYGLWPRSSESQLLEQRNIGYLRLPSMGDGAVETIRAWMPKFAGADGLIVDVRGNGGGSRAALLELAAHLMNPADEPRIANVCKYRLFHEFPADHLSRTRFVHRENSDRFDDRDRHAIDRFRKNFKPEWNPPAEQFSEWHYLVLSKKSGDQRYDYRQPVVILMDEKCFSATDIFLGAFKGWPTVTLVGQPSSGGSARAESFQLPNSGITIRCASMASFQPDGRLYDTHGIQPDVVVHCPPEYFLNGGRDVFMDKAFEILQSRQ